MARANDASRFMAQVSLSLSAQDEPEFYTIADQYTRSTAPRVVPPLAPRHPSRGVLAGASTWSGAWWRVVMVFRARPPTRARGVVAT